MVYLYMSGRNETDKRYAAKSFLNNLNIPKLSEEEKQLCEGKILLNEICYSQAGRSVLGKTVPEVSSTARGRRPRAVLETEGTVFPNTDRPRPVNNIFIYF